MKESMDWEVLVEMVEVGTRLRASAMMLSSPFLYLIPSEMFPITDRMLESGRRRFWYGRATPFGMMMELGRQPGQQQAEQQEHGERSNNFPVRHGRWVRRISH